MESIDTSRTQAPPASGAPDNLAALDREILLHHQHDKDQGVLTHWLSGVWDGGSRASLKKLEALANQADAAQASGNSDELQRIEQRAQSAVQSDSQALSSCDTKLSYATGALKTAGLFIGNKFGLAMTLGVYGLDNARSGDTLSGKIEDGFLGAGKGLALRKTFEFAGSRGLSPIGQGVTVGVLSRFSDLALTRSTYQHGFWNGLGDATVKSVDKHALALDAATFLVAGGLFHGADLLSQGRLTASPMLNVMATGGAFGVTTGATSEIARQTNRGEKFDLSKVLKSGLIQGGIDTLAAGPGGAMAARSLGNTDLNFNRDRAHETSPVDDTARQPRQFVVTDGRDALNRFISSDSSRASAMVKVRELLGNRQGAEQSLFVQHLSDTGRVVASNADLLANCLPEGSLAPANHVLPDAHGAIQLHSDAAGERIAFTTGDTTAPGYERSVELGLGPLGEKLQRELINWCLMPNGPDSPHIAPEMRELREMRDLFQKELKNGNWRLFETGAKSAADRAKMDYLLINQKDGRWTFFDTTLDPDSKNEIAELRRPGIVVIHREENSPNLATKMDFMVQVIDSLNAHTPFNMKEIQPPSWDASKSEAQILADTARFRLQIGEHEARLTSALNAGKGTDWAQARQMDEDVRNLQEYNEELGRAQKFNENELARRNDPKLPRYIASIQSNVTSVTRNVIGVMMAKRSETATDQYSSGPARTRVEYDPQYDRLFVYANGGQKYQVNDLTELVRAAVKTGVEKKNLSDYGYKRLLLAGDITKSVRGAVISQLEHLWSGVLIGEPGLKDPPPAPPGKKRR
ncbi:MAG TPA: hypothetical protein V6C81_02475 [Planktothrix sp.]